MKTLLTLILAVTCILLHSEYFFTTNNMMMFEFFISAIPSFVLSLQPNTERVKGKFIPYVLSRSIPGALTMATGILTLYCVHKTSYSASFGFIDAAGADTIEYQALMMIALTFTGLVMLYRICQPFNVVRVVLFVIAAALCLLVISIPEAGQIVFDGWRNVHIQLPQFLLIVIIIQASFPVSGFLIKFFDMMNPADDEPAFRTQCVFRLFYLSQRSAGL